MKKIIYASLLTCCLASTTAYAYTNEAAGYMLDNKTPEVILEGPKVYGYMPNTADKAVHVISYFAGKELEPMLNQPFTTAYFEENYAKLAILDKNKLDKTILNLPLLDLQNYAKLNDSTKAMLASDIEKQFKENIKPEIRLDKIGGNKTITLNLCYKQDKELVNSYITLLSQHDMLYILSTGTFTEDVQAESSDTTAKISEQNKKEETKDTATLVASKVTAVDKTKLDATLVKKIWQKHEQYVKNVKFTEPASDKQQHISFTDSITAKNITLPDDWAYAQYNYRDAKNPGILTFILPVSTFGAIGEKWADDAIANLKTSDLNKSKVAKKLGEEALSCMEQLFICGSIKLNNNPDIVAILANPLISKLQAEVFLAEGLKRLKDMSGQHVTLNAYSYNTNFKENQGQVDVNFDYTVLGKYDFLTDLRITGTNSQASGLLFVTKKGIIPNAEVKNIYDTWSF